MTFLKSLIKDSLVDIHILLRGTNIELKSKFTIVMDHKSQPTKCMYNSAYRMNKMNSFFCSPYRRKSQSLSRSGNVLFLSDHGCCSCLCDTVCLSHKRYGSRYNVQVHNDKAEVLLLLLRQTSSCGKQLLLICERRDIP